MYTNLTPVACQPVYEISGLQRESQFAIIVGDYSAQFAENIRRNRRTVPAHQLVGAVSQGSPPQSPIGPSDCRLVVSPF
jgi:hypothetical protein